MAAHRRAHSEFGLKDDVPGGCGGCGRVSFLGEQNRDRTLPDHRYQLTNPRQRQDGRRVNVDVDVNVNVNVDVNVDGSDQGEMSTPNIRFRSNNRS